MQYILLIVLALISSISTAEMTCNQSGCIGIPYRVLSYPNGTVNIYPLLGTPEIGGDAGPLQCTGVDNNKAMTLPDGEGKDRTYSMILAAVSAKKIDIYSYP